MVSKPLPDGLVPGGSSPEFTDTTMPDALLREHALGAGHWGLLHVLEGSVTFVDLGAGSEQLVSAPRTVPIHPQVAAPADCQRARERSNRLLCRTERRLRTAVVPRPRLEQAARSREGRACRQRGNLERDAGATLAAAAVEQPHQAGGLLGVHAERLAASHAGRPRRGR